MKKKPYDSGERLECMRRSFEYYGVFMVLTDTRKLSAVRVAWPASIPPATNDLLPGIITKQRDRRINKC
ncbi:MAG: hypothetical protein ACYSPI_00935 [Planctomycetota bacterium]|jgi:hypothetical protein